MAVDTACRDLMRAWKHPNPFISMMEFEGTWDALDPQVQKGAMSLAIAAIHDSLGDFPETVFGADPAHVSD